jgi:hypothetical protein
MKFKPAAGQGGTIYHPKLFGGFFEAFSLAPAQLGKSVKTF